MIEKLINQLHRWIRISLRTAGAFRLPAKAVGLGGFMSLLRPHLFNIAIIIMKTPYLFNKNGGLLLKHVC